MNWLFNSQETVQLHDDTWSSIMNEWRTIQNKKNVEQASTVHLENKSKNHHIT